MGSVAPDQGVHNAHRWGARLDQHNKRERGYASGAARSPPTGMTLRATPPARCQLQRSSPKRGENQTSMALVSKWCYTTYRGITPARS